MWRYADKTERGRIRTRSWFALAEYLPDAQLKCPVQYKVHTTWRIGPVQLERDFVPRHSLGIPVNGEESFAEARTIWRFKIEWGDTWP